MKSTQKRIRLSLSLSLGLPDLKKVVVIPYARSKHETDLSKIPNRFVLVDGYNFTKELKWTETAIIYLFIYLTFSVSMEQKCPNDVFFNFS